MWKETFKNKETRNKILFVLFSIIILRIGVCLPVPFVDTTAVKSFFQNNDTLSFVNLFTGGSMENFSILSLSITPYITASIILQLLCIAFPKLDELQKDGDTGKTTYNKIMKLTTVALSIIEAIGLLITYTRNGLISLNVYSSIVVVVSFTAGTMFLMWLGDEITERGIGNGISIILMINILSRIPSDLYNLYQMFVKNKDVVNMVISSVIIISVIVITILLVIILDGAERHVPINNSRKIANSHNFNVNSNIPLKVNMAGVVPIIFASTLLSIPIIIASFFKTNGSWTGYFSQNQWFSSMNWKYTIGYIVYAILVIFFAYFYASITVNSNDIANNLKKSGQIIPGIRHGKATIDYLDSIKNPLIFIGAIWLLFIVTIPIIFNGAFNASVSFGGTSIIIVVGVIVETITQLRGRVVNYSQKSFLKKF